MRYISVSRPIVNIEKFGNSKWDLILVWSMSNIYCKSNCSGFTRIPMLYRTPHQPEWLRKVFCHFSRYRIQNSGSQYKVMITVNIISGCFWSFAFWPPSKPPLYGKASSLTERGPLGNNIDDVGCNWEMKFENSGFHLGLNASNGKYRHKLFRKIIIVVWGPISWLCSYLTRQI